MNNVLQSVMSFAVGLYISHTEFGSTVNPIPTRGGRQIIPPPPPDLKT